MNLDHYPYDPRPEVRALILETLGDGELSTRAVFARVPFAHPLVRWMLDVLGDEGAIEARRGPRKSILWRIAGTPTRKRAVDAFNRSSPGHEVV